MSALPRLLPAGESLPYDIRPDFYPVQGQGTQLPGNSRIYQVAVSQRPGNYLVYFPSFEYLNNVLDFYRKTWPEDYIIVQRIRMDDDDRKKFLEAFDDAPGKTMIAFAVMGGIFAEGIDLAGDRLSGAVVVGVGLPQLSVERDLIAVL